MLKIFIGHFLVVWFVKASELFHATPVESIETTRAPLLSEVAMNNIQPSLVDTQFHCSYSPVYTFYPTAYCYTSTSVYLTSKCDDAESKTCSQLGLTNLHYSSSTQYMTSRSYSKITYCSPLLSSTLHGSLNKDDL